MDGMLNKAKGMMSNNQGGAAAGGNQNAGQAAGGAGKEDYGDKGTSLFIS